ncbi:MAG: glycosyltransferase [Solirubrobacteraceae bacterium]
MNIVIASVPIHGHVNPLLGVARSLVARGDRVRFLTGARFADAVTATGAEHVPLPDEADFDDRLDLAERFPERTALSGVKALAFDVEHVFVQPARAQHDAVMAAHAAEPADAVLADPAFAGGAYVLGHPPPRRPAVVVCGVLPLSLASPDVAPFGMGLPPARRLNRTRNRALSAVSRPVFRGAERIAADTNRSLHGVPLPHAVLDWASRADAIAQFTVASFEYPRADMPATVHFVGPITVPGTPAPRPDWWGDLDSDRPVVHVTQGTIANKDPGQLIGPALEALADEDVLVVVSTGGEPIDTLPALPGNARAAEYIDHDELLPHVDAFVTNGGYGGVQKALRHGLPIVATGGKEDKPEVGARIAWSGAGRRIRTEQPRPQQLRRAIRAVLDDPSYKAASGRIAADMAAAPGVEGLFRVVDAACGQNGAAGAG